MKFNISKIIKKLLLLFLLVLFLIVFGICIPRLGKITHSREAYVRIYNLEQWNLLVLKCLEEKKELPRDLFDLVNFRDFHRHDLLFVNNSGKENVEYEVMLKERDIFARYVDYELITVSPNTWFIMEKRPGKLFQRQLAINQDNEIFKLVRY
jgi:hypothetical protein